MAGVTKAYILSDGTVISEKDFRSKFATKAGKSLQLPPDAFEGIYETAGLVEPLYSLEALAQLLELNTYHYRCCKTKARDTAGLGWTLQPVVPEPSDDNWDKAMALLNNPSPDKTLTQINDMVMVDYEATGNGFYEIIRDENGEIVGLEHIPAHTMRVARDMIRYCQMRGNKKRWFKKFGVEQDIDFETGELGDNIPPDRRGNEVIHIKNYTSRSDYYGVPDILPALGAILAERERQNYNIAFFENHAVPAYVVTVTGADLDDETKALIKQYFQNDIKNNRHATLVITASKPENDMSGDPIEIKFQPLSVEQKEASFRLFRQDNRDEILSAHGVPPYRAGIAVVGNLGGTTAKESTEIYKQSIIKPRQEMIEGVINRILDAMGIEDWRFKFNEIDAKDENDKIDRLIRLFNIGVYSPNQILDKLGEEPIKDNPAMDMHYLNGRPLTMNEQEESIVYNSLKDFHKRLVEMITKAEKDIEAEKEGETNE